jgi:large subunit ribosomal protein L23
MRAPELIIKRPLLTEKGTFLKDTGGNSGEVDPETVKSQLLFEVAKDANKVAIRYAVEKLWNVDVLSVRTSVVRGKEKRVGRFVGKVSNWKKAVVTIAAGQNIEFFEGV